MWRREDVVRELRKKQRDRSLRAFARELGCSAPYLSDVYRGKRDPGPLILDELGLEKVVPPAEPRYRKKRWR